jgi:type IV secretory pathway VirD2 relaxase
MFLPWKPHADPEAGVGLGRVHPKGSRKLKRLVPWWVGAMRRVRTATGLRRQSARTQRGGAGRRKPAPPKGYSRRVMTKISFKRNRKESWANHARYLSREHAQTAMDRGLGFDEYEIDIDMVKRVKDWAKDHDQLMWSIIISPEDAGQMDMHQHIRDLVQQVGEDLQTRLEWVAIDHHNTDHDHVHLLIRGRRDDGQVLLIDRDYIRSGFRDLSRELAERELGPRTEEEFLVARGAAIQRDQWTEIDRALARTAGGDRVISYDGFEAFTEAAAVKAKQEIDRLKYLEKIGLAKRIEEQTWELAVNHEPELRRLQQEHDIIRTRARERQQNLSKGLEIGS